LSGLLLRHLASDLRHFCRSVCLSTVFITATLIDVGVNIASPLATPTSMRQLLCPLLAYCCLLVGRCSISSDVYLGRF
jgi:hypothetical protein